jgi:hypothetical protein
MRTIDELTDAASKVIVELIDRDYRLAEITAILRFAEVIVVSDYVIKAIDDEIRRGRAFGRDFNGIKNDCTQSDIREDGGRGAERS